MNGNWTDPTKWSSNPNYPDNDHPPGTTYDVTIDATGGPYTVTLGSNISINSLLLNSGFATLHHTSGRLSIANSLELRGGVYRLDGGTIGGGLLKMTGGALDVTTNAANRLSGVTVQGGLSLNAVGARLRISDGFAHNNIMFINGDGAAVSFDGTQTISSGFFSLSGPSAGRRLTIEGPSTVTFNPGVTVSGGSNAVVGGQLVATGGNTLINKGSIRCTSSEQTLFVAPAALTNQGTLSAQFGGTLTINAGAWTNSSAVTADGFGSKVNLNGAWSSTGTLNAINGGLLNLGGTFLSTALGTLNVTGGSVSVKGTMDNTGNTFTFNNSTGSWDLAGGTIRGGTINFADGKTLNFASESRLEGVTWNADLRMLDSGTFLNIGDGLTLNGVARLGSSSSLTFDGTQTFNTGSVNIEGNLASVGNQSGTLTLGPGMAIDVHAHNGVRVGGRSGDLVNEGRITVDGAGGYVNVLSDNLTNTGVIEALNGSTLRIGETGTSPGNWSNSGILRVNNSTLRLGGSFTAAGMGTIERTGGTVVFEGRLDNTGSTLTLDSTTGSWHVDGAASILGGTIDQTEGAGLLFDIGGSGSAAIFEGVTLNGDIDLSAPDRGLLLRNGIDLNGTIRLSGERTRLFTEEDQSQTIAGGTIAIESPASNQQALLMLNAGSTLTLSPTTLVRGGNGGIGSLGTLERPTTLTNQGAISADVPGRTLSAGAWTFINEGTLEAVNGGTLSVSAATPWVNRGLIRIDGGTVNLGGTVVLDTGTTFERNGGTLALTGTLDNVGRTLTLDSSTGSLNVRGQTRVNGGVINATSGQQLLLDAVGGGQPTTLFDGVTFNGDIALPAQGGLSIQNDFVLNGTVTNTSTGAFLLGWDNGTFRNGTYVIQRGASGSSNDAVKIGGNRTLTIASTATVRGDNGWIGRNFSGGGTTTLVNQGLISADVSAGVLTLKPDTLVNEGTLEAKDGGSLQIDYWTRWTNVGTIRVENGGRVFLGGKTTTAGLGTLVNAGGTFYLSGLLENTGSTLTLNATTGSLVFASDSGSIKGGTVNMSGGARLSGSGIGFLDGVTVNGEIDYPQGGSIRVRNGLALNGTIHMNSAGASLTFEGTQRFDTGTIAFEGAAGAERFLSATSGSALSLGSLATVHGGNGRIFTTSQISIVNYGLISADVSGQKITINTDRFDNQGVVEAINGGIIEFIDPPPGPDGGSSPMVFVNAGVMSIGAGSLGLITSAFVQAPTGTIDIRLDMDGSGRLLVQGEAELDGMLRLTLAAGVAPGVGQEFHILDLPRRTGAFANIDLPTLPQGMWWDTSRLYSGGTLSAVPAPGPVAILCTALAAVLVQRRRQATTNGGAR